MIAGGILGHDTSLEAREGRCLIDECGKIPIAGAICPLVWRSEYQGCEPVRHRWLRKAGTNGGSEAHYAHTMPDRRLDRQRRHTCLGDRRNMDVLRSFARGYSHKSGVFGTA